MTQSRDTRRQVEHVLGHRLADATWEHLEELRYVADFEYEYQLVGMNRQLDANIETIFIMANHEYQFIASRLVKEIAQLGGDVSAFVPANVEQALQGKLK